jgi:hypothetical protein
MLSAIPHRTIVTTVATFKYLDYYVVKVVSYVLIWDKESRQENQIKSSSTIAESTVCVRN